MLAERLVNVLEHEPRGFTQVLQGAASAKDSVEGQTDKKGQHFFASQNGKPCWSVLSLLSVVQQRTPPAARGSSVVQAR
jgi:hypothetical protein